MRIKLFNITISIILIFLSFFKAATADNINNYSLLINDSYRSAMWIKRFSDGVNEGSIISYGGYKWFKSVYGKKTKREKIFIQPGHHGIDGNEKSWMLPKYEVDNFRFDYGLRGTDAYINFASEYGIDSIEGYFSRGEKFSLATLQPSVAWYAATWIPIKNLNQIESLSLESPRIFCKISTETFIKNNKNRELGDIFNKLKNKGYKCDSNFNLVSSPLTKKFEKVAEKPSKEKKVYDPLAKDNSKSFKDYWWVLIILGLGAFFLYTTTVKKPLRKFKKIKTIKKTEGRIAKYWAGQETLGFSFWGICFLLLGALYIPLIAIADAADNMSGFFLLVSVLYVLFFFVAAVVAYVGCWRSAGFYIKMKLKKKSSAFWGYATYVYLSLSILRSVVAFFQEF